MMLLVQQILLVSDLRKTMENKFNEKLNRRMGYGNFKILFLLVCTYIFNNLQVSHL